MSSENQMDKTRENSLANAFRDYLKILEQDEDSNNYAETDKSPQGLVDIDLKPSAGAYNCETTEKIKEAIKESPSPTYKYWNKTLVDLIETYLNNLPTQENNDKTLINGSSNENTPNYTYNRLKQADAAFDFNKEYVRPLEGMYNSSENKTNYIKNRRYDEKGNIFSEPVYSVLQNDKLLQYTKQKYDADNEAPEKNWLRLIMPQYSRRVEIEDLNRNFWVIAQTLSAISYFLFDDDNPITKMFTGISNELLTLWENVLYLWYVGESVTQEREFGAPRVIQIPVRKANLSNNRYDSNNFFTENEYLSDDNLKKYLEKYIKQYNEDKLIFIPYYKIGRYYNNYYSKEYYPYIVLYNRHDNIDSGAPSWKFYKLKYQDGGDVIISPEQYKDKLYGLNFGHGSFSYAYPCSEYAMKKNSIDIEPLRLYAALRTKIDIKAHLKNNELFFDENDFVQVDIYDAGECFLNKLSPYENTGAENDSFITYIAKNINSNNEIILEKNTENKNDERDCTTEQKKYHILTYGTHYSIPYASKALYSDLYSFRAYPSYDELGIFLGEMPSYSVWTKELSFTFSHDKYLGEAYTDSEELRVYQEEEKDDSGQIIKAAGYIPVDDAPIDLNNPDGEKIIDVCIPFIKDFYYDRLGKDRRILNSRPIEAGDIMKLLTISHNKISRDKNSFPIDNVPQTICLNTGVEKEVNFGQYTSPYKTFYNDESDVTLGALLYSPMFIDSSVYYKDYNYTDPSYVNKVYHIDNDPDNDIPLIPEVLREGEELLATDYYSSIWRKKGEGVSEDNYCIKYIIVNKIITPYYNNLYSDYIYSIPMVDGKPDLDGPIYIEPDEEPEEPSEELIEEPAESETSEDENPQPPNNKYMAYEVITMLFYPKGEMFIKIQQRISGGEVTPSGIKLAKDDLTLKEYYVQPGQSVDLTSVWKTTYLNCDKSDVSQETYNQYDPEYTYKDISTGKVRTEPDLEVDSWIKIYDSGINEEMNEDKDNRVHFDYYPYSGFVTRFTAPPEPEEP